MSRNLNHELFERHPDNPILSVSDWPYRANSVFNAAAAELDGKTILLARVEDFRGISHLTAARSDDGMQTRSVCVRRRLTYLPCNSRFQ